MPPGLAALQASIEGDVLLPGSPAYETARKPWMARFHHVKPVAVVLCKTAADVAETVRLARHLRLETAIRSGGHCFAGRSCTQGLLIDVGPMSSVSVRGDFAAVGAGARLGEIDDHLTAHGRALAAGSCPSVGIAGLTLGGGLGILGRRYGLTCDQLAEAQVVLADGRVICCDEQQNGDLFWALRGAGAGQFGVVTRLVFTTVPAEPLTCFKLAWPHHRAAAVIVAWQAWAPAAPGELAASLLLNAAADPGRPPAVTLFGAMLGAPAETERLLDELAVRAAADPDSAATEQMPYREAKRHLAEHAPGAGQIDAVSSSGRPDSGALFIKSEFFGGALPRDAIEALVRAFGAARAPGQARELDFTPWGGAYSRVRSQATAFAHRNERFLLKHAVTLDAEASEQEHAAGRHWLARSWASVHPWGSGGVFPNFPDPNLSDAAHAYHGTSQDRLMKIKAKYDPGNLFRFHQSLPPGAPAAAPRLS